MSEPGPSEESAEEPSLEEKVRSLAGQVDILVELLAKKDAEIDRQRAEIQRLLNKLYRHTSEKIDPNQLLLNLAGTESAAPPAEEPAPVEPPTKPRRKPKGHGRSLLPGKGHCAIGRFWVAVGTGAAPYCWFDFTEDRSTKERDGPLSTFDDFQGHLHADAYGGYDKLFRDTRAGPQITELACWAHARRYFHGALDSAAAAASWMIAKIQALYRVEKSARGLLPDERLALRQKHAAPLLAEMKAWKEKQIALPKSPMGKALTYLGNQWDALNVYTTAGHLEIDNNPAERALRPVAVGRKNWLFVGPGTRGGKTAAVLYSFTASCRKLHIDPLAYLTDVLTRIMDHSSTRIDELLPIPWIEAHPEARYVPAHAAPRR